MSSIISSLKGQSGLLLLNMALTGLTTAFIMPIMTYFLVDELNAEPIWIGIYTSGIAIFGIVAGQWLGNLADKGVSTKYMYLGCMTATGIATLVYANTNSYIIVLITGLFFIGFGNSSMPQMMTIARQYADKAKLNITDYNSVTRSAFSFAWIAGPPIAFFMVAHIGFTGTFLIASAVAALSVLLGAFNIPNYSKPKSEQKDLSHPPLTLVFWLIGLVMLLGNMANSMYMTSMPLYILKELDAPSYLPGLLMGAVALLEIPFMILTAKFSEGKDKKKILIFGSLAGLAFYIGIYFSTEVWQFVALQVLNGIFFGSYVGLGITIVQDQMPDRIGFTSAFYMNTLRIGSMVGTAGTGIFGQFLNFRSATLGSAGIMILAIFALLVVIRKRTNA